MKRLFLGIFIALCMTCYISASVFTHTFRFDEADFTLTGTESDSLRIISLASASVQPAPTQPCIPYLGRSLALGAGEAIGDYTVTYNKRLVRENVDLANASVAVPTNVPLSAVVHSNAGYAPEVYPDSVCRMTRAYPMGAFNLVNFLVTPFEYDAANRKLYFIDSIEVSINLTDDGKRRAPARMLPTQLEILEAIVDNKEMIAQTPMLLADDVAEEETIDYIIITSQEFESAFKPLANWKRKKGVRTKIVTVEEIERNYSEDTQQKRIKSCIIDHVNNHYTQFVLLGGDVNIVPSQPSFVMTNTTDPEVDASHAYITTKDTPADVYYACLLDRDFDWDINKDGLYGDIRHDRIPAIPMIHVSRLPVRNANDVTSFVNRIISYEQSPVFVRSIFQGGAKLEERQFVPLYGERLADLFFNNVINGKVILGATKYFDSFTYNGESFSNQGFANELSKGYQFCQVFSHGKDNSWLTFDDSSFFDHYAAQKLSNKGHSLITTMACETNAFDRSDINASPCLSEALIRNTNSGVIGYVGSSRFGWYDYPTPTLELSMAYERDFYDRLLNTDKYLPTTKHLGALLTFTKCAMLPLVETNILYRWLHYSINVLGDPETPIFNGTPLEFVNASVDLNDWSGEMTVNTGVKDARICVSSVSSLLGNSYYEIGDGLSYDFSLEPGSYDIWITKQNYIPKHFTARVKRLEIVDTIIKPTPFPIEQPTITSISPNPATSYITIKYQGVDHNSSVKVSFTSINSALSSPSFNITGTNGEATINVSYLSKGTYVVNLIVDGVIMDSSQKLVKL